MYQLIYLVPDDSHGYETKNHIRSSWSDRRAKAGPLPEVVNNVDLPAHVGRGVAVVVDHVRPGHVRFDLHESRFVVLLTARDQAVPELAELFELVVSPPVPALLVFPDTQPPRVIHWAGHVLTGELDASQHSDLGSLLLRESLVAADRLVSDDEGVVVLSTPGVVPALHLERVSETSPEIKFRCQISLNIPDQATAW